MWKRENVDALVMENVQPELSSSFVADKPLVAVLGGQDKAQKDRLGDPTRGVRLGGRGMGKARKKMIAGTNDLQLRFQKSQSDASESVPRGGATPVASVFAEDLVGTARFRWALDMAPGKIRQSTIDNAREAGGRIGRLMIASAMEEAVSFMIQRTLEGAQNDFWNGTLTAAQQDAEQWASILGLRHLVSDGTTSGETSYTHIGGVDRTVHTQLASVVNLAADLVSNGHLASTVPTLNLIRKLKSINSIGGIANKAGGPGVADLAITTPELWNKLADEADGNATIYRTADMPPEFAVSGFRREVILYDSTWITFDNDCPSGELYLLSTRSFMYEVQKNYNYQLDRPDWTPKWRNEEGGDHYVWNTMNRKDRLSCSEYHLQVKCKNLTTS